MVPQVGGWGLINGVYAPKPWGTWGGRLVQKYLDVVDRITRVLEGRERSIMPLSKSNGLQAKDRRAQQSGRPSASSQALPPPPTARGFQGKAGTAQGIAAEPI